MEEELAEGTLVIPCWTTQAWFAQAMRILVVNPRLLAKRDMVVFLPFNSEQKHPLQRRMNLVACHLSWNPSRTKEFLNGQLKPSLVPDEMKFRKLIHLLHLLAKLWIFSLSYLMKGSNAAP